MKALKIGTCPVCGEDIRTNQRTVYRLVDGKPARIHRYHLREQT